MAGRLKSFCRRLRSKKGEMLIETLISIAIIAVVMITVTSLIVISSNMINASNKAFANIAEAERSVETGEYRTNQTAKDAAFEITINGQSAETDVLLYDEGDIAVFEPEE